MSKTKLPTPEEVRAMYDDWCQDNFGMSAEQYAEVPWDVRIAMLEKAGIEFAATGPDGGMISNKAGPPKATN